MENQTAKKHIHFVGICGVGTSAVAIAFHNQGWVVTGSDKGFFPPVSTELEKTGVAYYAGWHPEKMTEAGPIEFIVAGGGGTSSRNPELIYAKEQNIPIYSMAEAIGKYLVKENSIVCVGTWGKTTTSSLLSYILEQAGKNPSYFSGGVAIGRNTAALTDGTWSVVEGDEYQSAIWDKRPKFAHYKPTHLLLTAVSWDHADLYPTEQSYMEAFKELINSTSNSGKIAACIDNEFVRILTQDKRNIATYGADASADYRYENVAQSKTGISFSIIHKATTHTLTSPLLGIFQAENITGCFAIAHSIGIDAETIIRAIGSFKGLKRRLERRFEGDVTVIDDIAHSPEKARSILSTIRAVYPGKIVAVFEPNIGGRRPETKRMYKDAFKNEDLVVIPRLSKLKASADESEPNPARRAAHVPQRTPHYGADSEHVVSAGGS